MLKGKQIPTRQDVAKEKFMGRITLKINYWESIEVAQLWRSHLTM